MSDPVSSLHHYSRWEIYIRGMLAPSYVWGVPCACVLRVQTRGRSARQWWAIDSKCVQLRRARRLGCYLYVDLHVSKTASCGGWSYGKTSVTVLAGLSRRWMYGIYAFTESTSTPRYPCPCCHSGPSYVRCQVGFCLLSWSQGLAAQTARFVVCQPSNLKLVKPCSHRTSQLLL